MATDLEIYGGEKGQATTPSQPVVLMTYAKGTVTTEDCEKAKKEFAAAGLTLIVVEHAVGKSEPRIERIHF